LHVAQGAEALKQAPAGLLSSPSSRDRDEAINPRQGTATAQRDTQIHEPDRPKIRGDMLAIPPETCSIQ